MVLASISLTTSAAMPLTTPRPHRFPTLLVGVAAIAAFGVLLLGVERGWLAGVRDLRERGRGIESPAGPSARATADDAASVACPSCGTVHSVGSFPTRGDAPAAALRVTVRMDDGSYRSFAQPSARSVGIGERVRIVDGAVVAM